MKKRLLIIRLCRPALFLGILSLFVFLSHAQPESGIRPVRLTCEYQVNPVIVDVPNPRLSWINTAINSHARGQKQTAWQVRVASTHEKLMAGEIDLWDSGKRANGHSIRIAYDGKVLHSTQDCWWQVRVWDIDDIPSSWSDVAYWGMGLLDSADWQSKWIGAPWQGEEAREDIEGHPHVPAPMLRKLFNLKKNISSAKAFVSGLGYFEFYVNGRKVGEEVLSPNQTNYGKRDGLDKASIPVDDKFRAYRVLYLGYDITSMLKQGENVVGAIIGNGFYNPVINWTKAYGSPRFTGQIHITYEDDTQEIIVSDETWEAKHSPIVLNGVYAGEIYDARKETEDWNRSTPGVWTPVALRKMPEGIMSAQTSPPDRIMEKITPVSVIALEDGTYEVDFGEEISGWVRLNNLKGMAGDTVEIKYLSESPNNGVHKYIMKGTGDEAHAPRFTWYVFRKVHVLNYPGLLTADRLTAEAVYSDMETTGRFECSNHLFNRIDRIWWRSLTDNVHGGVMSDCPHRERSAYTGDGQVACVTVMHHFDAAAFYTKWIRDIADAQNTETGYVPNGAPWQPGCGGGVAWGAAMNIMPWEFYLHYGDKEMLSNNYEAMKEQVRYMLTWRTPEGTMFAKAPAGRESVYWMNLGDWCPPYENPADELVHTFFMWRCMDFTARAAKALALTDDEQKYNQMAEEVKQAFHKKFYNPKSASYGDYGGNVFALKMGVPEKCHEQVVESLRKEIAVRDGHLHTGIFGTQFLFEVLAENGLSDVAYTAMNKRSFPSFGHWIAQGATTTWEQWDGQNSRNHPMFGGALTWFYRKLAGMNIDERRPGYKHIVIRPVLPDSLTSASYSTRTPYGEASVSWQRGDTEFCLQTVVPVGSQATVYIPCSQTSVVTESGISVDDEKIIGITDVGWKDGYRQIEIVSGIYEFNVYSKIESKKIRFGLVADIQYGDCETRGNRFYRNSLEKLNACIDDFNKEEVAFVINLGDLVDRDTEKNLGAVLSVLEQSDAEVYNTSGNHDYDGVTDNEALYARLGMPASYYSFLRAGWRFILLNTNEVASYANVAGTSLEKELESMMEQIHRTGRKNGASYNGGVSKKQLEWLKKELETAEEKNEKVLILSHHPLYAAPGLTALNDQEILAVLSAFSCVKAGISGHHHPGDFGTYNDIPFITTEGMIETENENAYGFVEITADRILLTGKGRTRSYTLPMR